MLQNQLSSCGLRAGSELNEVETIGQVAQVKQLRTANCELRNGQTPDQPAGKRL